MIEYSKQYKFENELAKFNLSAKTFEHPNPYGNGTILVIEVESVRHSNGKQSYDIRYENNGTLSVIDVESEPIRHSGRQIYDIRYERLSSPEDVDELVAWLIERDYGVSKDGIEEV